MKTSKIGVLLCTSLQCGCVKSQEDSEELIKEGYLNVDGTLTKKATSLLESIQLVSTAFENSNEFKDNCAEFLDKVNENFNEKVSSVKKTTSGVLSAFSGMLDEAAKKLKN